MTVPFIVGHQRSPLCATHVQICIGELCSRGQFGGHARLKTVVKGQRGFSTTIMDSSQLLHFLSSRLSGINEIAFDTEQLNGRNPNPTYTPYEITSEYVLQQLFIWSERNTLQLTGPRYVGLDQGNNLKRLSL